MSVLPSGFIRSRTSSTRSRGTSGSGRRENRSYGSGIFSRASSSTSRNPAVASRHSFAPRPWMIAFTPTVEPWVK